MLWRPTINIRRKGAVVFPFESPTDLRPRVSYQALENGATLAEDARQIRSVGPLQSWFSTRIFFRGETGMPDNEILADTVVALNPPQSFSSGATTKVDLPPALQDFRTCLFYLVNDADHKTSPPSLAHSIADALKGMIWPMYRRQMSYGELVGKYVSLWYMLESIEYQSYSMQALLGVKYLSAGRLDHSSINI